MNLAGANSPTDALSAWTNRLKATSEPALGARAPEHSELAKRAFIEAFRDEAGQRQDVVAPVLCWQLGLRALRAPATKTEAVAGDALLWWALVDETIDPSQYLRRDLSGPVLDQPDRASIEVWTERELTALHALWNLAHQRDRADWRDRCLASATWIIDNLQPDNATNHPWAIHVFVIAAIASGRFELDLYAQTLLHNCQVSQGQADRWSAWILRDAASALESFRSTR